MLFITVWLLEKFFSKHSFFPSIKLNDIKYSQRDGEPHLLDIVYIFN